MAGLELDELNSGVPLAAGELTAADLIYLVQADESYATTLGAIHESRTEVVSLLVTDPNGAALATGDGKAFWPVPSVLDGYDLTAIAAFLTTTSSSGDPTIQLHNLTQTADMLSTAVSIDAGELTSATAATPAVVDAANDDVATGDMLRIDVDVAGTGAKGLIVELQFEKP